MSLHGRVSTYPDTSSTQGGDRKTAISSLRRDLKLSKRTTGCPYKNSYVPRCQRENLITINVIRDIILENLNTSFSNGFVREVHATAPILFAVFVSLPVSLTHFKTIFDRNIRDGQLPIDNIPYIAESGIEDDFWDVMDEIKDRQYTFFVPAFDRKGHHYHFEPHIKIPWTLYEKLGGGSYGTVHRVQLEPSHQAIYQLWNKEKNPCLALKVLKPHEQADKNFTQERDMLSRLLTLKDRHIVALLATYTQFGTHHLLFPFADCNLRTYMEWWKAPDLGKPFMLWFINQLRGLTYALSRIHNYDEVPENYLNTDTGQHHDLKPENILFFSNLEEDVGEHGILQLGDFGLGKFRSRDVGTLTQTMKGAPTYRAPESEGGGISRPYDVFSLGCIFLEMIVWLLYGSKGLLNFSDGRVTRVNEFDPTYSNYTDDAFYIVIERGGCQLRPQVKDCITRLHSHPSSKDTLGKVLLLVESALEMDHNKRIKSYTMAKRLEELLKQAESEPEGHYIPITEVEKFPTPTLRIDISTSNDQHHSLMRMETPAQIRMDTSSPSVRNLSEGLSNPSAGHGLLAPRIDPRRGRLK
ncbi:MAG: hypothetical protein M1833_002684 [Piccolia ochrophora]|nr:MAG: hypothetical protein M1833_002684 [Piccolia ochrophora]